MPTGTSDMPAVSGLTPGFADPVGDSQETFRAVLSAMSRPGRIVDVPDMAEPPAPIMPGAAAVLLTLVDYDTALWLDNVAARPSVIDYLKFHTGAPQTDSAAAADFALVADAKSLLPLSTFKSGTEEYPDRSATLIVQVESLASDRGWALRGPGIETAAALYAAPLPSDFLAQLRTNAAGYPCGVDIIFVAGNSIAALPRSTRVEA